MGLAEAGATVICSGRSTRFGYRTEGRHETVEDAAEAVKAAGGEGHPYICDHTDPKALYDFASWVLRRFGPPSLVACAVWGGNEGYDGENYADGSRFGTPFHERSLQPFETAMLTGPYAVLATARAFAPVMIRQGVDCSFPSVSMRKGRCWRRLLRSREIGDPASERDHGGRTRQARPGLRPPDTGIRADGARAGGGHGEQATQTPLYVGRAVAALAALPDPAGLNGQSLFVADLAASMDLPMWTAANPRGSRRVHCPESN